MCLHILSLLDLKWVCEMWCQRGCIIGCLFPTAAFSTVPFSSAVNGTGSLTHQDDGTNLFFSPFNPSGDAGEDAGDLDFSALLKKR